MTAKVFIEDEVWLSNGGDGVFALGKVVGISCGAPDEVITEYGYILRVEKDGTVYAVLEGDLPPGLSRSNRFYLVDQTRKALGVERGAVCERCHQSLHWNSSGTAGLDRGCRARCAGGCTGASGAAEKELPKKPDPPVVLPKQAYVDLCEEIQRLKAHAAAATSRADEAIRRASKLADDAGILRAERDELLLENAQLRRKNEQLAKKMGR